MDPVVLIQFRDTGHPLQEEGHQDGTRLPGHSREDSPEPLRVGFPQVGGRFHRSQKDRGLGVPGPGDPNDLPEVLGRGMGILAPEAVIRTQLHHQDV
jgi:hypothetical protein